MLFTYAKKITEVKRAIKHTKQRASFTDGQERRIKGECTRPPLIRGKIKRYYT